MDRCPEDKGGMCSDAGCSREQPAAPVGVRNCSQPFRTKA